MSLNCRKRPSVFRIFVIYKSFPLVKVLLLVEAGLFCYPIYKRWRAFSYTGNCKLTAMANTDVNQRTPVRIAAMAKLVFDFSRAAFGISVWMKFRLFRVNFFLLFFPKKVKCFSVKRLLVPFMFKIGLL